MALPPVASAPHPRLGVTAGTPADHPAGPDLLPGGIPEPAAYFPTFFTFLAPPTKQHRRPDERRDAGVQAISGGPKSGCDMVWSMPSHRRRSQMEPGGSTTTPSTDMPE